LRHGERSEAIHRRIMSIQRRRRIERLPAWLVPRGAIHLALDSRLFRSSIILSAPYSLFPPRLAWSLPISARLTALGGEGESTGHDAVEQAGDHNPVAAFQPREARFGDGHRVHRLQQLEQSCIHPGAALEISTR
jgi:hypothetical protein